MKDDFCVLFNGILKNIWNGFYVTKVLVMNQVLRNFMLKKKSSSYIQTSKSSKAKN
jgi:hypothetical protein